MDKIIDTTIDRIKQFIDYKGLSIRKFSNEIGVSHSLIGKTKSIGSDKLETILSVYPELSAEWLLTGKGKWKKEPSSIEAPLEVDMKYMPLVSIATIENFGRGPFLIKEKEVMAYYKVPKFRHKKIDFMIEIEDISMYPRYASGDVAACTIILESSFIQWNKVHVIATKGQGVIIKRVQKSLKTDCLKMVSDNKKYGSFDIPIKEITGIAIIAGIIKLE